MGWTSSNTVSSFFLVDFEHHPVGGLLDVLGGRVHADVILLGLLWSLDYVSVHLLLPVLNDGDLEAAVDNITSFGIHRGSLALRH